MRPGCLVLCYHAISDTWDDPLATTAPVLERQVKMLLRRGYTAVDAEAAMANRPRTLHVTFDDAFRSVAGVLRTLERLGVPVTIFACSRFAERGDPFRVPELSLRQPADEDELLTMSWDTLGELAERGVLVGSHTASHPHLPHLGDADLQAELVSSRELAEARLGRPCRLLAYPYGHHDARVQAVARDAGYTGAFTLDPPTGDYSPYSFPRVGVYRGDKHVRFMLKTSRARQIVVEMRTRARLIARAAR